MQDAIIISDIHLGSNLCEAEKLNKFLQKIKTKKLIINGDLFDNLDFRKLPKKHWNILKEIRNISKHIDVTWISGNHDGHHECISSLLGINCVNEFIFESNDKKIFCTHGDRYDNFIQKFPVLTKIADIIYWTLQKIDKTHTLAIYAKKNSKTFMRNAEIIKEKAIKEAQQKKCNIALCGHTHHPEIILEKNVWYGNSGCWTEKICSYISISNGDLKLNKL
jgi:UDP-2,3-diacylglucosamine pyrophosphatase LpxH